MANVSELEPVSGSSRLTDRISLGVLADILPRDLIEEALDETGRRERRSRRLPAHVMVRFCLAMCLFFDEGYEEVMRKLIGSLEDMGSWRDEWAMPSTSAITQARQRLKADPLRALFEKIAVPVAGRGTKGAWLGSRRLMAVDGFMLDIADTPDNVKEFGRLDEGPKASAFPQARVVALAECGSHAAVAASFGPCKVDERSLLTDMPGAFEPDMLVIADRNLYSFELWTQALGTGADLLWRVSATVTLPVIKSLPDGSYRSIVINPKITGERRKKLIEQVRHGHKIPADAAIPVRVIEYEIPDREGNGAGELICLITSILDPSDATATELAAAYHERWEIETGFREKKTFLRGSGRVLRSKSPEMVRQEIWALLLTHYAIRKLMCHAADEAGLDPDRLSFTRSLRVIRRQVTDQAAFPLGD
ncbi:MAG: IS4 family transposase [Pseudonocardiales bacterium]|nr:IS4 family transposase [Pseudonocardiales bacterium]MBV9031888.1 IS4 family transposase [Pseudonocardiales bacterium]